MIRCGLEHRGNVGAGDDGLRTVSCGELFQAWEMWLSPHLEKPVGSELVGRTHIHG